MVSSSPNPSHRSFSPPGEAASAESEKAAPPGGAQDLLDSELVALEELLERVEPTHTTNRPAVPPETLGPVARRDATIMFLDLVGHTNLVCSTDAVEVIGLLNHLFALFTDVCAQYDVQANQYLGDGMMALAFGLQHARQAVTAALACKECVSDKSLPPRIPVPKAVRFRIGISSGAVVLGNIGTRQKTEFTAIGQPTNLAARLQEAARPGCVCIGSETHRRVQGQFVFGPSRQERLKGFGTRTVWDVLARRACEGSCQQP